MTCKDCLHYGVCSGHAFEEKYCDKDNCLDYTNRSEWVHLPCRLNLPKELYRYMFDDDYKKIVVKCKVGKITGYGFTLIHYPDGREWEYDYDRIGKTVFFTQEEAEKAIKEMNSSDTQNQG